jgi:hypothetical protein
MFEELLAYLDPAGVRFVVVGGRTGQVMTDFDERDPGASADWNGDFRVAEELTLEASLAMTPSQRLAWLEEALAFAWKVGALQRPAEETGERNGVPGPNSTIIDGS